MSVKALTWAFEQPISGNDKVVLLSLADHANDYGECWPSINRLSQRARVSVRTVQRCLAELENAKLIVRETRNDPNGRSTSNMYRLCISEQVRMPAEASGRQRKEEGVKLAPYDGDTGDRGEGVSGDGVEGVNGVTLIRTVIRNPHKETSNISYDAEFAEFWAAYPKRPGNPKAPAAAKYRYVREKIKIPHEALLQAAKAYAASREGEDPKFTAQAVTWLNQRRWEEEHEAVNVPAASDADLDAIVSKYPGVVSDRAAAKKALAAELANGVTVGEISEAAQKLTLLVKQARSEGREFSVPILETWFKFKWRDMDAYELYRGGMTMKLFVRPKKVK